MRGALGAALAALCICGYAGTAHAAPPCPTQPEARTLADLGSTLESIIAGPDGRLYFTDAGRGKLMMLAKPGAASRAVADVEDPGGLTFDADGSLLVGSGNSIPGGAIGNLIPMASLVRVDLATGKTELAYQGLAMANGLATGPDGAIYASDDAGIGIDRIQDGFVENRWATVVSSNGLVVDKAGEYLYAAQTFQPAAIVRIPLADPAAASTWVSAPLADIAAGPDGMTRDGFDRLYVAANGNGEIWRVNRRREVCRLATNPALGPSALTFGRGRDGAFPRRNLYYVTFQGKLVELKGVLKGRPRAAR
jgi:sugar lactone lactonase YvrE